MNAKPVMMAALVGVSALGGLALADETQGLYVGGGVGKFDVHIDDFDDLTSTIENYNSDDTAWRAFVGWRFNKFLALEGDYINLGTPEADIAPGVHAESKVDGFAPYVVGTVPLGPIELIGRLGYYWNQSSFRITTPLGTRTWSDNGGSAVWGVGLGLAISRVAVRLEYETYDIDRTDDTHALWLTGALRF
jgi:hypothetical protein